MMEASKRPIILPLMPDSRNSSGLGATDIRPRCPVYDWRPFKYTLSIDGTLSTDTFQLI